jgi:cytochrome P450
VGTIEEPVLNYPSTDGAECPFALFAHLREEAPVQELPERPGVYLVSRYDDVRYIFAHPELFSSYQSRAGLNGVDWALSAPQSNALIESDAPEHRPKRDLLFAALKPGKLRVYEERIRELVDELIDSFAEHGRCEFVSEFAHALPTRLTLWLMGVPDEDTDWIQFWARFEASGLSFMPPEFQEQQRVNGERMMEYLTRLLQYRFENPGDDVLTTVIDAQVSRDGQFDLPLVRSQVAILLGGGVVTTAHFLSSLMLLLIENPHLLRQASDDQKLIPKIIEEGLRLEPPSVWIPRRTKVDTELGGVHVPAGSYLVLLLTSANRDERHFECPEQFDVARRTIHDHVAFGYGPHFCIGAPLARIELRIAFERLLTRLGNIRLDVDNDFTHIRSPSFRGLNKLNIEFEIRH